MIVADTSVTLVLTERVTCMEPEKGIIAIGSGGNYAQAAARALADSELDAEAIARKAFGHCGRDLRLHKQQPDSREPGLGLSKSIMTDFSPARSFRNLTATIVGQAEASGLSPLRCATAGAQAARKPAA